MAPISYTNQTQTAGTNPSTNAAVSLSPAWRTAFDIITAVGVFLAILNFNCDTSLLATLYKRRPKIRDVEHAGGANAAEKVPPHKRVESSPLSGHRSPSPALPFQTSVSRQDSPMEEPYPARPGGMRQPPPQAPTPTPTLTAAMSDATSEGPLRSDTTSPLSDDTSSERSSVGPPSTAPTSLAYSSPPLHLSDSLAPNLKSNGPKCKSTAAPDSPIATIHNRLRRASGSNITSDPAFAAAFGSQTTLNIIIASQSRLPKTDLIEQWVQKSLISRSTAVSANEDGLVNGSVERYWLQHQVKHQDLRRHFRAPASESAQTCADSEELLENLEVD